MRTLSDRDLGIECDFVAEGETDEEIIDEMVSHLEEEHPEDAGRIGEDMMIEKIKEE